MKICIHVNNDNCAIASSEVRFTKLILDMFDKDCVDFMLMANRHTIECHSWGYQYW